MRMFVPSRLDLRGVSRSSRTWRRDAMAVRVLSAFRCADEGIIADGEIVRSRSPDAGIKSCEAFRKATVARSPAHRGDHV